VRDFLAWQHIEGSADELNITAQQRAQAVRRRERADDTVRRRVAAAYTWVLAPDQPDPARPVNWQVVKAEALTSASLTEYRRSCGRAAC
jgi:hypothetical protein